MTRQLITALIVAASSIAAVSNVQAGCHGQACHTGITLNGFDAQFGCSPRQAFLLFQQQPELITRFPEMAQFLQGQFGSLTATTPALAATPAAVATPAVVGATPAVATTPAIAGTGDAAIANPLPAAAPAAVVSPADVAPAIDAATTPPVTPAPADSATIAAPVAADPVAAATAPAIELPTAAPIQSELEPLLGLWINESDAADQPIAKINLANDGNATVTVNTALGQSEVTKPFAIADGTFKLDGNDLAKVVSADANKVVLDANGTNLTFIRP
ncbi:MAG: hypothetical protein AB7U20_12590 [Planctomycetaceae bacterium]